MMKRLLLGALMVGGGSNAMARMDNGMMMDNSNPHGKAAVQTAELTGELTSQQLIFEMIPMGREYLAYQVDRNAIAPLEKVTDETEILVVLATWNQASQLQVPRLMKILKILDNPAFKADYIGVDKQGAYGDTPLMEGVQVLSLPTIIVKQKGSEIGRIEGVTPQGLERALAHLF